MTPRNILKPAPQTRISLEPFITSSPRTIITPGTVARKLKMFRRTAQMLSPVVKPTLEFPRPLQRLALPARMVAVLVRQRRKTRLPAIETRLIKCAKLRTQHSHRAPVRRSVMRYQSQDVTLATFTDQTATKASISAKIKAALHKSAHNLS